MADFSKQWCDLNDPKLPHDFDILEIAEGLEPGHYTPVICEGFGFTAVAKNDEGQILLAMPTETYDEDGDTIIRWKSYSDIIK